MIPLAQCKLTETSLRQARDSIFGSINTKH
jgi:hypothetical protein